MSSIQSAKRQSFYARQREIRRVRRINAPKSYHGSLRMEYTGKKRGWRMVHREYVVLLGEPLPRLRKSCVPLELKPDLGAPYEKWARDVSGYRALTGGALYPPTIPVEEQIP